MTVAFLKDPNNKGKMISLQGTIANLKKRKEDFEGLDMEGAIASLHERNDCEAFRVAARLTRLFAERFTDFNAKAAKFVTIGNNVKDKKGNSYNFAYLAYPIVIKGDDGKPTVRMRVFKNIPINLSILETVKEGEKETVYEDAVSVEEIAKTSIYTFWPLDKFYSELSADLADKNRKKKWASTTRTAKLLKSYQDMTVAKFITNFTDSKTKMGLSDSQIRDRSAKIEDMYMPIELNFAETVADYINVYENGPTSCTKSNSSSAQLWSDKFEDTKKYMTTEPEKVFHPAVWYFYNPDTGLAYISRGKSVVCRSVTWTLGGKKYYGHVYSSDGTTQDKFHVQMKERGYTYVSKGSEERYAMLESSFEQPGIKFGDTTVCPIPYTDTFHNVWDIGYANGVFTFTATGKIKREDWHKSTNGFMSDVAVLNPKCMHCGRSIGGPCNVTTMDGKVFCGNGCALKANYVGASDGEGRVRWISKEECYMDPISSDYAFTNVEAAIRRGAKPVITCSYVPEDGSLVSVTGNNVTYRGEKYTMSTADYQVLKNAGLIGAGYKIKGLISSTMSVDKIKVNIVRGDFRIAVGE